ncbi:MAG: alcohol dehydrogenase catalytic domain-containing protein [Microbacteriaceae bacterium]
MKAAIMYGAGDVRIETVADPIIEKPTDAIVRIVRSCICGSDLHPYHAKPSGSRPKAMGHEYIGVVEDIGSAVRTLKLGDFVIASFSYQDNTCVYCRDGFQTSCIHGGFYGSTGAEGNVGGAQAEAIRVPQADGTLVVVPGVDEHTEHLGSLLALTDVYLTGHHAAKMAGVKAGDTVTIVGDGAVGLSSVLAAKKFGAERIILMGRHTSRTDLGIEFGATDIVPERGEEGIAKVMELTGGEGSPIVIEAVGYLPAYEQSVGVVRVGGIISRVGVPQYEVAPIGFASLFGNNITLTGGVAPVRAYMEPAITQVLSGEINPGRVFDQVITLDEVPQGYATMSAREALKIMVKP